MALPPSQPMQGNNSGRKGRYFPGFSAKKNLPMTQKVETETSQNQSAIDMQRAKQKTRKQINQSQQQNPEQKKQDKDSLTPKDKSKKIFTNKALKQSWINLFTTWGLSLIYINIHIFAKKIFKKKGFSEPGVEFFTNIMDTDPDKLIQKENSSLVKTFGLFEIGVVVFLDLAVLLVFLGIILIAAMPFILMMSAWDAINTAIGSLFEGIL